MVTEEIDYYCFTLNADFFRLFFPKKIKKINFRGCIDLNIKKQLHEPNSLQNQIEKAKDFLLLSIFIAVLTLY